MLMAQCFVLAWTRPQNAVWRRRGFHHSTHSRVVSSTCSMAKVRGFDLFGLAQALTVSAHDPTHHKGTLWDSNYNPRIESEPQALCD